MSRSFQRRLEIFMGVAVLAIGVYSMRGSDESAERLVSAVLILVGLYASLGRLPEEISLPGGGSIRTPGRAAPEEFKPRELEPAVRQARERKVKEQGFEPPGSDAPPFSVVGYQSELDVLPAADPFVPMYVLDASFRILDWNSAFALSFDRTMEGRRGESVMEWIYFLDNFAEVLEHTKKAFPAGAPLPILDIEPIVYTSQHFGRIKATKRAYQIPGDDVSCVGWLVLLEIEFESSEREQEFFLELTEHLSDDMLWSEYGMYYDQVLSNTKVYPKLLSDVIGASGDFGVPPVGRGAKVCDLGAGTGNVTRQLLEEDPTRFVVAIDNNRIMLSALRAKCRQYLRNDDLGPGVIPVKQDVCLLRGIPDGYFDSIIMNNVLYSVANPELALREANRVLRKGGDLRISGPKKNTSIQRLMKRIQRELRRSGKWESLRAAYEHVDDINRHRLAGRLYRWEVGDVENMIREAGLSEIITKTDRAYGGQGMIVCARK